MKRATLLLFLMATTLQALAQAGYEDRYQQNNKLNGRVKTVITKDYIILDGFPNNTPTDFVTTQYDKQGRITSEIFEDRAKKENEKHSYEYFGQDSTIRKVYNNGKYARSLKTVPIYNGNRIAEASYYVIDERGTQLLGRLVNFYSTGGSLEKQHHYGQDGQLYDSTFFSYYHDSNRGLSADRKVTVIFTNGTPQNVTYTYNPAGNLVTEQHKESLGSGHPHLEGYGYTLEWTYTGDSNNWTMRVEHSHGIISRITLREITYWP